MVRKQFLRYIKYILTALFFFIFLTNLAVHVKSSTHIYKDVKDAKEAETVIVLGAAVYSDGDLTAVYQKRVDKAFELYKAKKVSKILASGDNSTVEHNEVNPVRNYLLSKGVPDVDIYLDHAGFDTYSTMYRARDIFKVSSVIIVTQSFHLPRAVFIARSLGIDASGVPANDGDFKISNYIREILANEKAVLNIIFHRKPKYLGEPIPIGEERDEEKDESKSIDTTNWKVYTDAKTKITFKYPEKLDTKYITLVDWPPTVNLVEGKVACLEAGEEEMRAGKTEEIKVEGNVYCLTKVIEGAAGSTYTQYSYAKELSGGDTVILTFSSRAPQCANYDEPKQSECEAEQKSFDMNQEINDIFATLKQ
jgi:SanA protein